MKRTIITITITIRTTIIRGAWAAYQPPGADYQPPAERPADGAFYQAPGALSMEQGPGIWGPGWWWNDDERDWEYWQGANWRRLQ